MSQSLPQAEKGTHVTFEFEDEKNQIELTINDNSHHGWNIRPHKIPVLVRGITMAIFFKLQ